MEYRPFPLEDLGCAPAAVPAPADEQHRLLDFAQIERDLMLHGHTDQDVTLRHFMAVAGVPAEGIESTEFSDASIADTTGTPFLQQLHINEVPDSPVTPTRQVRASSTLRPGSVSPPALSSGYSAATVSSPALSSRTPASLMSTRTATGSNVSSSRPASLMSVDHSDSGSVHSPWHGARHASSGESRTEPVSPRVSSSSSSSSSSSGRQRIPVAPKHSSRHPIADSMDMDELMRLKHKFISFAQELDTYKITDNGSQTLGHPDFAPLGPEAELSEHVKAALRQGVAIIRGHIITVGGPQATRGEPQELARSLYGTDFFILKWAALLEVAHETGRFYIKGKFTAAGVREVQQQRSLTTEGVTSLAEMFVNQLVPPQPANYDADKHGMSWAAFCIAWELDRTDVPEASNS